MSRTEKGTKNAFIALKNAAIDMGLLINIGKTKYMLATSRCNRQTTCNGRQDIQIDNDKIKYVSEFTYLGSMIWNNITTEIKYR